MIAKRIKIIKSNFQKDLKINIIIDRNMKTKTSLEKNDSSRYKISPQNEICRLI
jgi:hypothetical protein